MEFRPFLAAYTLTDRHRTHRRQIIIITPSTHDAISQVCVLYGMHLWYPYNFFFHGKSLTKFLGSSAVIRCIENYLHTFWNAYGSHIIFGLKVDKYTTCLRLRVPHRVGGCVYCYTFVCCVVVVHAMCAIYIKRTSSFIIASISFAFARKRQSCTMWIYFWLSIEQPPRHTHLQLKPRDK